jgi:hypothetical protein
MQHLRINNETFKMQLRDLKQAPSHVPSIRREVPSTVAENNATAKSYRDAVCAVSGNPGATVPARNFLSPAM